jgi:hypothetical protein
MNDLSETARALRDVAPTASLGRVQIPDLVAQLVVSV